jgi:tetratricopeptide (TPR) repeat protein
MRRGAWTGGLALVGLLVLGPREGAASHVIPPGQEGLLLGMVGNTPPLPSGCTLLSASVERSYVLARYQCSELPEFSLELVHPSQAKGAALSTHAFALIPRGQAPSELLAELAARIATREPAWRWESSALAVPRAARVLPTWPASSAVPAEHRDAYRQAEEAFRQEQYDTAIDRMTVLSAHVPALAGALLAALAAAPQSDEMVARSVARAERDPADAVRQLCAGARAFYLGQWAKAKPGEKTEAYRQALSYLSVAQPAFASEPRVLALLAAVHYRLGDVAAAQALSGRAVGVAPEDPDVYAARAEAWQRHDPRRAAKDLQRYLELVPPGLEDTRAAVEQRRAFLESGGQPEGTLNLFDLALESAEAHQATQVPSRDLAWLGPYLGGVLLVCGGLWFLAARLARRFSSP